MTTIKTTITDEQGTVIEDGSVEAVKQYAAALKRAFDALDDARTALQVVPDVAEDQWRTEHDKVARKLFDLLGKANSFGSDFAYANLDYAVDNARAQKKLT